jgi:hypothetical protein
MTPLHTFSAEYYLYLYDSLSPVPAVVGFFPWGRKVILVGFDGTHPNALEQFEHHSWARTVELDTARRWWRQYTDTMPQRPKQYTTTPPADAEIASRVRTVCAGLALRHRDATLKEQDEFVPVDYFSVQDQHLSCVEQFKDALHDFLQTQTVRDPHEH